MNIKIKILLEVKSIGEKCDSTTINPKGSVSAAACLFDAEQWRLSSRSLFKSQFKAFVNDVEENSAQHEERRPERREVHVQQILPGHLVCSELRVSRTTAGHVAWQLRQVVAV